MPLPNWPQPKGPNLVGTLRFEVTDSSRATMFAPHPMLERCIAVTAWYPAAAADGETTTYFSAAETAPELNDLLGTLAQWPAAALQQLGALRTASFGGAPVLPGKHPLVVFNHGFISYRQQNQVLFEHLASHGYVVLSLAHPHESGSHVRSDGTAVPMNASMIAALGAVQTPTMWMSVVSRTLAERAAASQAMFRLMRPTALGTLGAVWADDSVFVVDAVEDGRVPVQAAALAVAVDTTRLAYIGMSFGGHVAPIACLRDPRARAAVNLDGGCFSPEYFGVECRAAVLGMMGDLSTTQQAAVKAAWPEAPRIEPPSADGLNMMDLAFARLDGTAPARPVHRLSMKGVMHMDYTDVPLLRTIHDTPGLMGEVPLEPLMSSQLRAVHEFLDRELREVANDFPAGLASTYPDLIVVHDRKATLARDAAG